MSRSVGSGTDRVLKTWERVNEEKEMSKEISKFFKKSLSRQKVTRKKKGKKGK